MLENPVLTIQKAIAKLRQLVQSEVQASWQDLGNTSVPADLIKSPTATLNDKGYVVFPSGQEVKWLGQQIVIPQTLQGYPIEGLSLRLVLTWWATDAQIFINGELVQQGDLFDSSARVLITDYAQPGQEYLVTIRLVSPHHDIGALMRSHLIYEQVNTPQNIDPGLVADEITVLSKYLSQFKPADLEVLAAKLNRFDWQHLAQADKFNDDLAQLRSRLLPLAQDIKQRRFNLLGHAHLDMAWLWTTDETYEVAERTFKSVLNLQQDFPALTFGHTSPALYEWIEHNRPELFKSIQAAVRSNKWEILGGMWVEPETNLVSGESLIRQFIYGQQYNQEKFGEIAKVAWLPDSFGFTWQLPQIMQQCGIEYFVTGKLHWNDTTKFPHGCFWWESPDGTQLLTLMSPPNVTGVMDTNPITMTNYGVDWEVQTGLQEIFWLPGVGDHGGGPTRDMLEVAAKWHNSPFFPQIEFVTARDYLRRIGGGFAQSRLSRLVWGQDAKEDKKKMSGNAQGAAGMEEDKGITRHQFPIWRDELYLELHRGCYTVHADQKKYNRRCERLLYEAELWSTLAMLLCGDRFDIQPLFPNIKKIIEKAGFCQANPQQLVEIAWKKVLFNQFHDILPGTSIAEVFTEANRDWEEAIALGESLLQHALNTIATSIKLPDAPEANAVPIVVFNSLNWKRSQIVTLEDSRFNDEHLFWLWDHQGNRISANSNQAGKLSFLAQDIPGVGYSLYWLCQELGTRSQDEFKVDYLLENNYLKVIVNPQTGNLDSIFDKINEREVLRSPANKLQAFTDQGQYWDAWNIDPEYEQQQLSDTQLTSIEWLEDSEFKQVIRVIKQFNSSEFIQDYILKTQENLLTIKNTVDWQETHIMVKVAFPLNLTSDYVTYEIPCGTIQRTTKPQTPAEKAQWEVPALNWADLTDEKANYGVSLLNDCKYGYDAQPNQLRLTLLRAATWPDPQSDRRIHHFTYCIYPHQNSWQEANTVQKGYELNTPLQTVILTQPEQNNHHSQQLPTESELLNLSTDNLILMALQLSNHQLTLRCYEAWGTETKLKLRSDLNLELDKQIDCLGRKQLNNQKLNQLKPYQISSFQLKKYL
ncbi:alpha-mannosidase [Pleurocapsa sp. CCALA 161]|uniref:alpha-mannosidase n=1 Tax=Pleurocapsa sp. CCALA 161 TaxID=2107688 RepID=UPI000D06C193|nr:alpha-mannosidase [Pleurocapsa sp. CCALA 161]PSB12530.1 alpha-mannosidase [Pleurocapsa sp. CCALA 161]